MAVKVFQTFSLFFFLLTPLLLPHSHLQLCFSFTQENRTEPEENFHILPPPNPPLCLSTKHQFKDVISEIIRESCLYPVLLLFSLIYFHTSLPPLPMKGKCSKCLMRMCICTCPYKMYITVCVCVEFMSIQVDYISLLFLCFSTQHFVF